MTLDEVEEYFGTFYRACKALGISPQNMTKWKNKGYVPLIQQYRLAEITDGELMPDDDDPAKMWREKQNLTKTCRMDKVKN